MGAVAAAFAVTIVLVNLPLTHRLLGFTQLDWTTQIASALVHGLGRQPPQPHRHRLV